MLKSVSPSTQGGHSFSVYRCLRLHKLFFFFFFFFFFFLWGGGGGGGEGWGGGGVAKTPNILPG